MFNSECVNNLFLLLFPRETVTIVELSPDVVSGARVLLVYRWPSGVYVDPYQLAFLREQRDWQVRLFFTKTNHLIVTEMN